MNMGKEKGNKTYLILNHIFQFQQLRAAETCMTSTPPKTGEHMPLTPGQNLIFN